MTQSKEFEENMIDIWGADLQGRYDEWSNANEYAQSLGASRTGNVEENTQSIDPLTGEEDPFEEWEFGDGSKTWIGRSGHKTTEAL